MVNSNPLDSDTDPCSPSVYYCNISSFQSWVTSHVYMTPISGMLAVFASKNKEVVQIRIQVLVWRQCLHGWSLIGCFSFAADLSYCFLKYIKMVHSCIPSYSTSLHFCDVYFLFYSFIENSFMYFADIAGECYSSFIATFPFYSFSFI